MNPLRLFHRLESIILILVNPVKIELAQTYFDKFVPMNCSASGFSSLLNGLESNDILAYGVKRT